MKSSIRDRLEQLSQRHEELERLLASQEVGADMDAFRRYSREHAELGEVVGLYAQYRRAEEDGVTAGEMLADPEMRDLAQAEIAESREAVERLELELQKALLPKDPDDDRNLFLEIRAGTGGEEAALAVGEDGRIIHYDGTQWRTMNSGTSRNLRAVWGDANGTLVAGDDQVMLYRAGSLRR